MRTFQRGETVEVYAEVKDQDGNYVDPSESTKVTVTDPDGTAQVTAQDMTPSATGKFVYYYTIQAADVIGWWPVEVTATDAGAKITKTRGGFEVEA